MGSPQRSFQRAVRVAGALTIVAAVTLLFVHLLAVNPTTVGFAYLITILVVATAWGLVESLVASIAATLCFNFFFFPPVGTFTIADPQNWVALFAFLATSLIASQLSERARRRTQEAVRGQLEMERLYSLSRAILLTEQSQPFARQIAREIARIYDLPAVAVYDRSRGETHQAGPGALTEVSEQLREAAELGSGYSDPRTAVVVTAISLGGQPMGGLALQGASLTETGLQALTNLVAVGIERARAHEISTRAEATRRSEEFKSTLLDALAHEFKTPLTSIKTAASAILSSSVTESEPQRELLTVIDQEASWLSALVNEALALARLEAGQAQLHRSPQSVAALIHATLRQMETPLEGRRVDVSIADGLPEALVDAELAQLVIRQLIDNAVKYSPPASPLRVTAGVLGEALVIRVRNEGPGISEAERSKIFEKFYRGADARQHRTGTGMGLAIAREIVAMHGGDLRVESSPDQGTEFAATFPVAGKVIRAWASSAY